MYSYTWDPETGGLLLNSSPLQFSKEPRPVYSKELDILGFDRYWTYDKDDSAPLMWAEANNYIYRGRLVAQVKGGSLKERPSISIFDNPEPDNHLIPIDVKKMVKKNYALMEALVQLTIKQIYNTYMKFQNHIDVFYVAFSGGKDSIVTLDLVQKALPHNSFMVLFGDTGMEFPDTYKTVDYYENVCKKQSIGFVRSKSDYKPEYTWKIFGPPATVNRWCCSVHKTSPQIVSLREYVGKHNFTGLAFVGIRASESLARNDYDYICLGEKHKGQYSYNPILEWNSGELYNYLFSEKLFINEAYKKGNRRAGCLVCPRAAERSDYFARTCYLNPFDKLLSYIRANYFDHFQTKSQLDEFIVNGGWKARKNGRDICVKQNYSEYSDDKIIKLEITEIRTDWKEWIKTIGELVSDESPYTIIHKNSTYKFDVTNMGNGYVVTIDSNVAKTDPSFIKLFKNVFRKSSSCIMCKVCEADCHNGSLHMKNGTLRIDDTCLHCSQCHNVEKGCLVYKSIEKPKILSGMKTQSLNCYSHHAPKQDWLVQFFKYQESFDQKHTLGTNMYDFFRRFLRDSKLIDSNGITCFSRKMFELGLQNDSTWALLLNNLAYSPQVNWFIKHIDFTENYGKDYVLSMLVDDGAKESWVNDIWSSILRFADLPFSNVGFCHSINDGKKASSITRSKWNNPNPIVILYSIYKFAEACGDYHEFTRTRLFDSDIDGLGVSPHQIFGIDKEELTAILKGLAAKYPDFISVSFTLDLDNIKLNDGKTSDDVLDLF